MANTEALQVTQTFSFRAPEAVSVLLVGDFTQWQQHPIPLKKQPDGVWKTSVRLVPGVHHYRFLVDGQWRDDPECALQVAKAYGDKDGVVTIVSPR